MAIPWDTFHLVFLDEVSMDNRDMWRTYGYGPIGERIVISGEFTRKARASLLCFLGVTGMLETFHTEGTFTRAKFFECVRAFATGGQCFQYPGRNSVWIMDGAAIHCDRNIVDYLRFCGIYVLFLPPYCPFLNPIELFFGYCKTKALRNYTENVSKVLETVVHTLNSFANFDCQKVFAKCGYSAGGLFNPGVGMKQKIWKKAN